MGDFIYRLRLCIARIVRGAMTSVPGTDAPTALYMGNINAPRISIGKNDALLVDNTVSPSVVSINGQQAATMAYADSHSVELFGQGADGAATLTGNNVLTRDVYYTNLTLVTGSVLVTSGFRVFVNGTLSLQGTARISQDGNVGANTGQEVYNM